MAEPDRIDAYGVHQVEISGPTEIQRESLPPVRCERCGQEEMLCAMVEYHWRGALWRLQMIFCGPGGHEVFRSRPERL